MDSFLIATGRSTIVRVGIVGLSLAFATLLVVVRVVDSLCPLYIIYAGCLLVCWLQTGKIASVLLKAVLEH